MGKIMLMVPMGVVIGLIVNYIIGMLYTVKANIRPAEDEMLDIDRETLDTDRGT